jgi:hypothetical protein
MDKNIQVDILSSKIDLINSSVLSYQNAIIEDNGKEPLSQETIAFYQDQINELILMKSALEQL